jgi:hypothetical protein
MTSEARAALREKVAKAMWDTNSLDAFVDAAIAVCMEEAARVAEGERYSGDTLTPYGDGYNRSCADIAAAIREMIQKEPT